MAKLRTCTLSELRIFVECGAIESTVLEVDKEGLYRCYFHVQEALGGLIRYTLVTQRSNEPRTFKHPGTVSRILKSENIHEWRVVNVSDQ